MRIVALVVLALLASACGRTPERANVASPCEAEFGKGEFGSNYAVLTTLSGLPTIGEEATLTVAACAKEAARTVVSLKLPDGFEWRTPPVGTTVTSAPGPYGGCDKTATGEWQLAAMTPVRVTGTVTATKAGPAELAGSVQPAEEEQPGPGNDAYVYLTVGADSSQWGYPDLSADSSATSATPRPKQVCV
jgi:hypothetical protein